MAPLRVMLTGFVGSLAFEWDVVVVVYVQCLCTKTDLRFWRGVLFLKFYAGFVFLY